MASYRHLARIAVMQTIFAHEFRAGVDPDETLKYCSVEFSDKLKDMGFAESLLKGVLEKKQEILEIMKIEAPEWPIDRIAPIDRAILEIGIYELIYSIDVPPVVAINEAVEVAKSYGDTNSPKFINGVLSTVMHKYKKE
jgi:transcription antitermination protein NusB